MVQNSSNSSNSSSRNRNTRLQISPSRNWCFTYNSYLEKDINDFLTICSNSSKKYVFQEEIGESGNKHLQGFISFNKKLRPKSICLYDRDWETNR